MIDFTHKIDGNIGILEVSKNVYCDEALNSAAYKFTDNFHIYIDDLGSARRIIKIRPKIVGATAIIDLENTMGELMNELLDQQLRIDLAKKNGHIRDMIISHAFRPIVDLKSKLGE